MEMNEMIEEVSAILKTYGYEVDADTDIATITRFLNRNANYINQQCNTNEVHSGLVPLLCDRAAADILEIKLNTNQLNIAGVDFTEKTIKSYSGGDVSISYGDSSSPTDRYQKIIASLRGNDAIFSQYRRIKW